MQSKGKTFYLVRHGEMDGTAAKDVDLNVINQYVSGDKDAGLSPAGRDEITKAAACFKGKPIQAVYCSHLARAKESAQILNQALGREKDADIRVLDHLAEINVGQIDPSRNRFYNAVFSAILRTYNMAPAFIARLMSPVIMRLLIYSYLFRWLVGKTAGGESVRAAFDRMEQALTDIGRRHDDAAEVIIISHGYFITLLAFKCVRDNPRDIFKLGNFFWVANGSVTAFTQERSGRLRLKYFARKTK